MNAEASRAWDSADSSISSRAAPVFSAPFPAPQPEDEAEAGSGGAASEPSGSGRGQGDQRSRFGAVEVVIVLSHYDLGIIKSVREFPRGSRRAPKLLIRSERGRFLLKRRSSGKDEPERVAFCHDLQLHLAGKQFPLPHLIGTRRDNNSMLQLDGAIYEMFEYIKGAGYDQSLAATTDSGKTLGLFHQLLLDYQPRHEPSRGSYHDAPVVFKSMQKAPRTLAEQEQSTGDANRSARDVVGYLHDCYTEAVEQVNRTGMPDWPKQTVHFDWHPGNMLFRGSRVVAVIDYDAARVQQRVLDMANGALQFSIIGKSDNLNAWPDYIDESRYKRFLRGYDSVPGAVISRAELRAIPWLMIEALIAESVIPVAATGFFARLEGASFLRMVERKVRWLRDHANRLSQVLGS